LAPVAKEETGTNSLLEKSPTWHALNGLIDRQVLFALAIFIFILENSRPIPWLDYRPRSTLMRPLNTHLAV
jgi:hypothetical protein